MPVRVTSPDHPEFWAEMVLDSISPQGIRLPTVHVHMPRIILAEANTHRAFSRNARSTRAVPTSRLIQEVRERPFMPIAWLKNKPGMSASEPMSPKEALNAEGEWLVASYEAVTQAERLFGMGLHKQWAGRVLEPFMWVDWLVTATDWNNFFALRDDAAAQPEMRLVAQLIRELFERSEPKALKPGEWHLPYIRGEDWELIRRKVAKTRGPQGRMGDIIEYAQKISTARCARLSYAPFDGNATIEAELERYDRLITSRPMHASPAEHQATPDWTVIDTPYSDRTWSNPRLSGNFAPGWIQYRKTLPHEHVK